MLKLLIFFIVILGLIYEIKAWSYYLNSYLFFNFLSLLISTANSKLIWGNKCYALFPGPIYYLLPNYCAMNQIAEKVCVIAINIHIDLFPSS